MNKKSMHFRTLISMVMLSGFIFFSQGNDRHISVTSYAQFLAGVSLLRTVPSTLDSPKNARCFRELQKVTGVTAKEMIAYLENIKSNPEKLKKLYDSMHLILTDKDGSMLQK